MLRRALVIFLTAAALGTAVVWLLLLLMRGKPIGLYGTVFPGQRVPEAVLVPQSGTLNLHLGQGDYWEIPLWIIALLLAAYPLYVWARGPHVRRRHRLKHGLCLECGYDLTGNVSGICPECGTLITTDAKDPITAGRCAVFGGVFGFVVTWVGWVVCCLAYPAMPGFLVGHALGITSLSWLLPIASLVNAALYAAFGGLFGPRILNWPSRSFCPACDHLVADRDAEICPECGKTLREQ